MIMNVSDEGYSRWLWTYLMKIIPDDYERIWWKLFQMIMNVSDESYSRWLWTYLMKVIPGAH